MMPSMKTRKDMPEHFAGEIFRSPYQALTEEQMDFIHLVADHYRAHRRLLANQVKEIKNENPSKHDYEWIYKWFRTPPDTLCRALNDAYMEYIQKRSLSPRRSPLEVSTSTLGPIQSIGYFRQQVDQARKRFKDSLASHLLDTGYDESDPWFFWFYQEYGREYNTQWFYDFYWGVLERKPVYVGSTAVRRQYVMASYHGLEGLQEFLKTMGKDPHCIIEAPYPHALVTQKEKSRALTLGARKTGIQDDETWWDFQDLFREIENSARECAKPDYSSFAGYAE